MTLKQRLQFRYLSPRAHTAIAVGLAVIVAFALTIGLLDDGNLLAPVLLYAAVVAAMVNFAVKLAGPPDDDGDSDEEAAS